MDIKIIKLNPADYHLCNNIWDMQQQSDLAKQIYNELINGNRITYIYTINNKFIGEISLVKDMNDMDYTIPNTRIYISRLIVKYEYRRQGIGKKLLHFITDKMKKDGYSELSIGVDLDNYPALNLYVASGFDKILYIGKDKYGKYLKLLKTL